MQPISAESSSSVPATAANSQRRNHLLNVAKVVVSLGLLALVISQVDLGAVWELVRTASLAGIVAALLIVQAGVLLRAWRWMALMRGSGDASSYATLLYLYYVGAFFNTFLPTGFGGDAIRIYELSQDGTTPRSAISTVVAERALGLLVQFAMALMVLPFAWALVPSEIGLLVVGVIVIAFVATALFMNRRLVTWLTTHLPLVKPLLTHPKAMSLYESFHGYRSDAVAKAAGISVVFNISLIISQMLLAHALGIRLSLIHFAIFIPVLSTLLLVPITIGGLGVREGGYVLLFAQVGVPQDQALALSLLTYATALASGVIGGILYVAVGAWRMHADGGGRR